MEPDEANDIALSRRGILRSAAGAALAAITPVPGQADELPLGPLPRTRYPDPRIEVLDRRFKYKIGNAGIERVATGLRWC